MSYLKSITPLSSADNLGGIDEIQVIRKAHVNNISDPVGSVVYGDITVSPGQGFVSWRVTLESPDATNDGKTSKEGSFRNNRLRFSIPKNRADLKHMFELASDDEFIVIFKDFNGKRYIFGSLNAPARFRYSASSGKQLQDKNGFEGEFYYEGPENMFEYQGEAALPPSPGTPSIVKFKLTGQDDSEAIVLGVLTSGEELMIVSDFIFQDFYRIQ